MLVLARHHIVYDGWCRGIISQRALNPLRTFSSGRLSLLPELPIQYVDFAQWQRQWLQGEVLEAQLAYWKKQLESSPRLSCRPIDLGLRFRPSRRATILSLSEKLSQGSKTSAVSTGLLFS